MIMKKIIIWAPINMRQLANHRALIVWFISYKKQYPTGFNVEAWGCPFAGMPLEDYQFRI